MKDLKFSLACLLAGGLILLAACCSGCAAPAPSEETAPLSLSGLSAEEIASMVRERDLLYLYLPNAQSDEPITREQLCGMAVQFTAAQRGIPYDALLDMTELYRAQADECGLLPSPYPDCGIDYYDWRMTALAKVLGLTVPLPDGTFRPKEPIPRQEAAAVLTAAYTALGGTLPADLPAPALSDWEEVDPACRDSIAALLSWGVMADTDDGRFRPAEPYTMAQCVRDFLCLYENAPVSRAKGNVEPMFSYQQVLAYYDALSNQSIDSGVGFREKEIYFDARTAQTVRQGISYQQGMFLEGPMAAVLRLDWGGSMSAFSRLVLIRKDGSLRYLDPGVFLRFHALTPDLPLENPRFSADGKTFLFTLTIPEDSLRYASEEPQVVCEAGTYHVTVDVLTGDCTTERETASP